MPLYLLILHLLLWLAPPSSSSESLNQSVVLDDAPWCKEIEYPFGVPNLTQAMDGFQINCSPREGGNKTLQLGMAQLTILEISLQGYVRVELSPIAWRCDRGISGLSPAPGQSGLSLEGTPYTFNDTRNKFTVIGCDALALIHAPGRKISSGCASFCVNPNSVIDGSCSGVGCCQASIPRGMTSFQPDFSSIRNLTHSRIENGTCTMAYVLEQDQFLFSATDINFVETPRSVVLDWAIGNETCEVARNETSFACKKNSDCYDLPTGGYRCNCTEGYSGNPYLGCQDIDECSDPQISPCIWKCINKPGSFDCRCRFGTTGDGRKQGEGCKRVQPLEIALGVGLGFLFILLMTSLWTYWVFQKRKVTKLKQKHFMQNGGLLLQQHISSRQMTARIFSVDELEEATDNFNESRVLGRGGNGTVYKGILLDQRVVAIKKAKLVDETQIEQFINEVVILSQINHKNVVKLLGCCLETQVPLLVYELISNGTLFHHVHNNATATSSMSWENRLRIAVETAGAIAYLHSVTPIPIIHRDIKSANILLDENFTAKVSDFGASRLMPYNQTHVTTLVQGTIGYLDPEYFHTSQLTEKSDVYSYGVVLVELLTKEAPVSFCRSEGARNLASYFILLVEENRLLELVDQQTVNEAGARHLFVVAQLARRCLSVKGEERPKMKEVAVELDALRRLMKQQVAQQSQEEEDSSCALPLHPCNIMETHVSSDTSRQYSMESHLLSSIDLPQ